jgi:hypothetical protein
MNTNEEMASMMELPAKDLKQLCFVLHEVTVNTFEIMERYKIKKKQKLQKNTLTN